MSLLEKFSTLLYGRIVNDGRYVLESLPLEGKVKLKKIRSGIPEYTIDQEFLDNKEELEAFMAEIVDGLFRVMESYGEVRLIDAEVVIDNTVLTGKQMAVASLSFYQPEVQ